jgi:hypothetical protein
VGTDESDGLIERLSDYPADVGQDEEASQISNGSQGDDLRQRHRLHTSEERRWRPRKDDEKHSRGAFEPLLEPLGPAALRPRARSEPAAPADPAPPSPIEHDDGQKAADKSEGDEQTSIQPAGHQEEHTPARVEHDQEQREPLDRCGHRQVANEACDDQSHNGATCQPAPGHTCHCAAIWTVACRHPSVAAGPKSYCWNR